MSDRLQWSAHAQAHDLLTVIVINTSTAAFLRSLQFYRPAGFALLAVAEEASLAPAVAEICPEARFLATGGGHPWAEAIAEATTPYLVFAEAFDFLRADALVNCVDFLNAHPSYGLCQGYSMAYQAQAESVDFLRRDKPVGAGLEAEAADARLRAFFAAYQSVFNAVVRVEHVRAWGRMALFGQHRQPLDISYALALLARAKGKILPIGYAMRSLETPSTDPRPLLATELESLTPGERDQLLALAEGAELNAAGLRGLLADLAEGLAQGTALGIEPLVESRWVSVGEAPLRRFGPNQYVEMPFYNAVFFDWMTDVEFFLHALPAQPRQLAALEGVWLQQQQALKGHANDTPETSGARLWQAATQHPFNREVVAQLLRHARHHGSEDDVRLLQDWQQRLATLAAAPVEQALLATRSGQLLAWLEAREPTVEQLAAIRHVTDLGGALPVIGILLLDLEGSMQALQSTFDSLMAGHFRGFKVVVLTTAEAPARTLVQDTVHFVEVDADDYIPALNRAARLAACDWLMLAEAGDRFTSSGLLRAALELRGAQGLRAVLADEIQQGADGAWTDVFRPGFNLDLLLGNPAQMARHWLVRADALEALGGYSAQYPRALEFDLALRLIEAGGVGDIAHLDEPLLITAVAGTASDTAESAGAEEQERQTLLRHLASRGYHAEVHAVEGCGWTVEYRHAEHPAVAIIIDTRVELGVLQQCLVSIQQRTRHQRYEVLAVIDDATPGAVVQWLREHAVRNGKVRVVEVAASATLAERRNSACAQTQAEYLVLLAGDAQIVTPNWLDSLLNHAQRPEVGLVGARLVDVSLNTTQAGLIVAADGSLHPAFAGAGKSAAGYMARLRLDQGVAALDDVCLMIARSVLEQLGGFSPPGRLQDIVQLCCAADAAGYLCILTPKALILHTGTLPTEAHAQLAAVAVAGRYSAKHLAQAPGFRLAPPVPFDWAALV